VRRGLKVNVILWVCFLFHYETRERSRSTSITGTLHLQLMAAAAGNAIGKYVQLDSKF
jgi:hypothetical protein